MNNLGFALLGLLARDDLSGYDLAKRLKMPLGFFWQAGHSQIYPELVKLEARGFVLERIVVQERRPNKKVYSLTPTGREALRTWVLQPPERMPPRDELILKTYSVWLSPPGEAARLFAAELSRHKERLKEYEGYRKQIEQAHKKAIGNPASPHFAMYATLLRGIGFERDYLGWCRWMVKCLTPLPRASRRHRTARGSGTVAHRRHEKG